VVYRNEGRIKIIKENVVAVSEVRVVLALLHDASFASAFFSPLSASFCEPFYARYSSGPKAFDWSTEGVASLAANYTNCLEHGLS
jgi:hypothetical protein